MQLARLTLFTLARCIPCVLGLALAVEAVGHELINVPKVFHYVYFFFNDTATTEIYTLSLHDGLPIFAACSSISGPSAVASSFGSQLLSSRTLAIRSEEHTSELQSLRQLVCRPLP